MTLADVGSRLRAYRIRLGLTQEAVARSAKTTPKFVSQIENGRVNPSIGVLGRLLHDGLNVSFAVFFCWDPSDGDPTSLLALAAKQPVSYRRRLLRALEVLCDDGEPAEGAPVRKRRSPRRVVPH